MLDNIFSSTALRFCIRASDMSCVPNMRSSDESATGASGGWPPSRRSTSGLGGMSRETSSNGASNSLMNNSPTNACLIAVSAVEAIAQRSVASRVVLNDRRRTNGDFVDFLFQRLKIRHMRLVEEFESRKLF